MNYGLITARIYYRLPDYPGILQTFVYQTYDSWPALPVIHNFLDYWQRRLDGKIHSVELAHDSLVTPVEMRNVSGELRLH